jgi:hypothetical protein
MLRYYLSNRVYDVRILEPRKILPSDCGECFCPLELLQWAGEELSKARG